MKVLHVISNVSPSAGGPPQVLRGMTKAQALSGLSVHICTTNRCPFSHTSFPLSAIRSYFDSNVKVHIFPAQLDSILFSFRLFFWLIFSMPGFDVVHIHGLYRFPASFAALIARFSAVRAVGGVQVPGAPAEEARVGRRRRPLASQSAPHFPQTPRTEEECGCLLVVCLVQLRDGDRENRRRYGLSLSESSQGWWEH